MLREQEEIRKAYPEAVRLSQAYRQQLFTIYAAITDSTNENYARVSCYNDAAHRHWVPPHSKDARMIRPISSAL